MLGLIRCNLSHESEAAPRSYGNKRIFLLSAHILNTAAQFGTRTPRKTSLKLKNKTSAKLPDSSSKTTIVGTASPKWWSSMGLWKNADRLLDAQDQLLASSHQSNPIPHTHDSKQYSILYHKCKYQIISARLQLYKLFFPQTFLWWNALPSQILELPSIGVVKRAVGAAILLSPTFFLYLVQ